jgi:ubiquitin C-terminal hydrolase
MIECMHNSKKRTIKIQLNGNAANETDRLAIQCYNALKENYERGDYSEFAELLQGVYISRLSTPNGEKLHSIRPEIYSILDLPIPLNCEQIHLHDCFNAFVASELLADWENEQTREKELVRKNAVFWNFPQILIIALKRYSPDGRYKNNAFVDFPLENLDLSKYVVGYKPSTFKYDLFGVANHMGSVNGGHYTAFSRSLKDKRWFCYNDSAVTEMSASQVVSPTAYCLFYRKQ